MHCPDCKRETYYPKRVGAISTRPADASPSALKAELRDGTCTKCRRAQNGSTRMSSKGVMSRSTRRVKRAALDLVRAQSEYESMCRSRRYRGIPEDGLDPAELANPSL